MIRSWFSTIFLSALLIFPCCHAAEARRVRAQPTMNTPTLVTWPAPAGEPASPDYTLAVNGQPVFVYPARVREKIEKPAGSIWTHKQSGETEWAAFAAFDFEGRVQVEITPARKFGSVQIAPTAFGIQPEISDGVIRFTLDLPRKLTVMLDGSDERPLHLFTSAPEQGAPTQGGPDLLYFGPGVHETGPIQLKDGQSVYLAGGAVVHGVLLSDDKGTRNERTGLVSYSGSVFNIRGVKGVRIYGRGILDGSRMPHPARSLLGVIQSSDVVIEGIILRDSPNWNIVMRQANDVVARDLKIISGRLNSDGINPTSSSNVTISDCFIRNRDDGIAVKTLIPSAPSANVIVEDNTLWSDWGYALGITYETRSDIRDVVFRRCHVIFARHHVLGVHVVDSGTISSIRFEDITVENMDLATKRFGEQPKLIRIALAADMWGTDKERGHIKGVALQNISVLGPMLPQSEIFGIDATHRVEDVQISGFTHEGTALTTTAQAHFRVNAFAGPVLFTARPVTQPIAP